MNNYQPRQIVSSSWGRAAELKILTPAQSAFVQAQNAAQIASNELLRSIVGVFKNGQDISDGIVRALLSCNANPAFVIRDVDLLFDGLIDFVQVLQSQEQMLAVLKK
jgi:hypothetical protein